MDGKKPAGKHSFNRNSSSIPNALFSASCKTAPTQTVEWRPSAFWQDERRGAYLPSPRWWHQNLITSCVLKYDVMWWNPTTQLDYLKRWLLSHHDFFAHWQSETSTTFSAAQPRAKAQHKLSEGPEGNHFQLTNSLILILFCWVALNKLWTVWLCASKTLWIKARDRLELVAL